MPIDKKGYVWGAFSTSLASDEQNERLKKLPPGKCFEIRPVQEKEQGQITAIRGTRFIELWKEPENAKIAVVGAKDETDLAFEDEIKAAVPGTEILPLMKTEPEFVKRIPSLIQQGWKFLAFDLEGSSSFPGLRYDAAEGAGPLLEQFVPKLKGCGAWIQVGFSLFNYSPWIEKTAVILANIPIVISQGVQVTTGITATQAGMLPIPTGTTKKTVQHPWTGSFYGAHGAAIAKEYSTKKDTHAVIVHVRGIIVYKGSPPDLSNVGAVIKTSFDALYPFEYSDSRIIRWMHKRALPDPRPYLEKHYQYHLNVLRKVAANQRVKKEDENGWYSGRDFVPVQCVNQAELPLFNALPQSLALGQYIQYARPSVPELSAGYYTEQGEGITIGVAPGKPPVVITPASMRRHALFVGSTGSGKTYLDILMIRGLERLNKAGKLRSMHIYLDMKGDDSEWIVQSSEAEHLIFLDPQTTGYADNPFRLPPYDHSDPTAKEIAIIKQKGIVLRMFEEAMGVTADTTPRLRRILGSNLVYLWHKKDDPTPVDLQDVVAREQEQDPGGVVWKDVEKVLPPGEFDELRRELQSVTAMPAESKDPVMGRLTDFATNLFAKQCFSPEKSTLDWYSLIQQPNTTIVIRLARLPADMAVIFQAATINSVYSALERRAETVPEDERTLVVFFIDEFQHVQRLGLLEKMHREGRTKNIVLVLSTQSLVSVPKELLAVLLGSGIQGMGVPSNDDDPAMFAARWRPENKDEVKQALMAQGALQWTFYLQGQPPAQRTLPVLPPRVRDATGFAEIVDQMKAQYGGIAAAPSVFAALKEQKWQGYWPKWVEIPAQREWRTLVTLKEQGTLSFYRLSEMLGINRKDQDAIFNAMAEKGFVAIEKKGTYSYCSLGEVGEKLVNPDIAEIVKGEDGRAMAEAEIKYHQSKLHFIYPAIQNRNGRLIKAPDFIVFDYQTQEAFAVETESEKEVETHGEQVMENYRKWYEQFVPLGLKRLEVWCHADQKEHIQYLVTEFLRDKEPPWKDKIAVVAVEELGQAQPEQKAPGETAPAQ